MTRPRLYLHIGHPKTGTTSIQNYLLKHAPQLRAHGYLHPRAGRRSDGHATHFRLFPITYFYEYEENKAFREMAALHQEVARLNPSAVVISCETAFADNAEDLRRVFINYDVTILYYIRRQDLWLPSFYGQRTKYSKMPEFRPLRGLAMEWIPSYLHVLRRFEQAFGKARIRVRPFEKNAWFNGDLLQDFLHEIGLDPADFPPSDFSMNESLKPDYRRFLLACNQLPLLRLEAFALRQAIAGLSANDSRAKSAPLLDNETRRRILDRCAEENAIIAREFLDRPDGILFRDPFEEHPSPLPETEPLPPGLQHDLFSRLPASVQETLAGLSPRIRKRRPGESFLPAPCPDNPALQHRIWCLREHEKLSRQLHLLGGPRPEPLDGEAVASWEAVPEIRFFERLQAGLGQLRSAILALSARHRPDLAIPPPLPPVLTVSPDGAAFARACLLLPLWPAERQAILQDLIRLSEGEPGPAVRLAANEEHQPAPPDCAPPPPPERQHALFARLSPPVRQVLTFISPSIRERMRDQAFWPLLPADPVLWRQRLLEREFQILRRYLVAIGDRSAAAPAPARRRSFLMRLVSRLIGRRVRPNTPRHSDNSP